MVWGHYLIDRPSRLKPGWNITVHGYVFATSFRYANKSVIKGLRRMPKSHFHQANIFNVLLLVSCFGTHIRYSQTEIILLHKLNANDLIKFIVTIACVAGVQRGGRGRNKKNKTPLSPIWALVTQAIVNTCSLSGWYQTISHWLISVNNIFWLKQMKAIFHWANRECYEFLPCLACGKLFFIEWISVNTQFFENLCRCETNKLHIIMSGLKILNYKYISSTGNAVLILDTPTPPA